MENLKGIVHPYTCCEHGAPAASPLDPGGDLAPAEANCFAAGTLVALADEQELNHAAAECASWNWYALTLSLASLAAAGAVWRLTGPGRRSRNAQSEALLDQIFAEDWLNDGDRETHEDELAELDCLFAEDWLQGQAGKVNRAA